MIYAIVILCQLTKLLDILIVFSSLNEDIMQFDLAKIKM